MAVHGIAAHPYKTWEKDISQEQSGDAKHLGTKINWLDHPQMLPKVCPRARIMTFGYDSQWFGDAATKQDLTSVSNNLLLSLTIERSKCPDRPLIFIGHCYSGLVIQKALLTARYDRERWKGIYDSAIGLVFLATPHRGTGHWTATGMKDTLNERNAQSEDYSLPIEDSVLETLKAQSPMLDYVRSEFVKIWTASHGGEGLVCFYEQKATTVGRIIGEQSKVRLELMCPITGMNGLLMI